MANLPSRRQRKKQLGLEEQLDDLKQSIQGLEADNFQLKSENDALHQIINGLEDRNAKLMEDNRRLQEENSRLQQQLDDKDIIELQPFSDISSLDTPTTRPSTAETGGYDESKEEQLPSLLGLPQREERNDIGITYQIIEDVRGALLISKKVSEGHKDFIASRGNMMVVYFQLTKNAQDLYGYSIVDSDTINDQAKSGWLDNKSNIQLYVHRSRPQRDDLKTAGKVQIVLHDNGAVESPMDIAGPGDILLWIRTNESINNIKAQVAGLFREKFLTTLNYQCKRREKCQETEQNVELVADIIGGAYQDIRPEPTQEQLEIQRRKEVRVERPVRQYNAAPVSFQEYTSQLRVPQLQSTGEDFYERYWYGENVWKPDYIFEDEEGAPSVMRPTRYKKWYDEAQSKARVTGFKRLEIAVAVKNVVKYVLEMIDYFHQRLDLAFMSSQIFIDAERNFFYGHDIGKHDHITGPTPILADLIDHMYDVRIGLVFIDELCYRVMKGLEPVENPPEDDIYVQFLERVLSHAKRYDGEKEPSNYPNFKRINYIAYIQRKFEDKVAPPPKPLAYGVPAPDRRKEKGKILAEDTLGRFEIERLYARYSLCSLRNYYEAAKACGVESIFSFMQPDRMELPKLETELERETGQLSVKDDLLLPWYVDGYRIRRPEFLFLSHWRTIVSNGARDVFDEILYQQQKNKTLGDLARLQLVDKREYLFKKFLIIGQPGSMRGELDKLVNTVMIETGKYLEGRYQMYEDDTPLSLVDRRISTHEQEYYTYKDVLYHIRLNNPEWGKASYRKANPILWITGLNDLFGTRRQPGQIGNLVIKSLTDIETDVLFQLDNMITYYKEQDMI